MCKTDLRFILYNINNTSTRINIHAINSTLNDLEIIINKLLYPHSSIKILLYHLFGKVNKLAFIYDLQDFLKEKMEKIVKKNKIEIITNSEVLIKFSNHYNERCNTVWKNQLSKSKEYCDKSLAASKGEFYFFEFGFSLQNLLLELADVNLLLAEYVVLVYLLNFVI